MSKNMEADCLEIAVVGIGALFPGRPGLQGFWRDVQLGVDNISDIPASYWLTEDFYDADPTAQDKTYARRGGFIPQTAFDPLEFGLPPTDLPATDTAQLLALIVAKHVLEQACDTQFQEVDKSRTSVILGVAAATELVVEMGARLQRPVWVKALREAGLPESEVTAICDRISDSYVPWKENSFPGMLGNVVAGRIANRLDLGGSNYVTDAACASSLSALQAGINELTLGHSDMVISGGVDALNDILMFMCFSKTPAFSPTGDIRPFSSQADGTLIGEGLGMFALRRLSDAERDGNSIFAVIRGIGSSSDGRSMSVYAPRSEGQAAALKRAYAAAGYEPRTVELVEAHGTGTKAGDLAEFGGLRSVFAEPHDGALQWCGLGTIKSQIGHTKAAAGAAGLLKIVLALHQKVLPPTIKIDAPNPNLELESSPFYLNTVARPWIRSADHPRRASVSSFGFGGSNFHVAVEEYTGNERRAPKQRVLSAELILLSATTRHALAARCAELLSAAMEEDTFSAAARRTQLAFDSSCAERLMIVATSIKDLHQKLERSCVILAEVNSNVAVRLPQVEHMSGETERGKCAFLFPGQGSQYLNMGAEIAMAFDRAREVWDGAANIAGQEGPSPHEIVFPIPVFKEEEREAQEALLTRTDNAQPALAATSLSMLALLAGTGLKAEMVAGHSFGEITALHAADVFGATEAMEIGRRRGQLMQDASRQAGGAMLAVNGGREEISERLSAYGVDLSVANDNGPDQVVLSGELEQIEAAEKELSAAGIKNTKLAVSAAFHSSIVNDCVEPFETYLGDVAFGAPSIPVFRNTTAEPYSADPKDIRRQLAAQLAAPVRFREMIERMYEEGARTFVEIGPGATLCGLVERCLGERPHAAIPLDRRGGDGVSSLWEALGRLSVLGFELDLSSFWEGFDVNDEEKVVPPHAVLIDGSNYEKPYPPSGGAKSLPEPNPERPAGNQPMPEPLVPAQPSRAAEPPQEKVGGDRWLVALEAFQKELSASHLQFQATMAESHQAYLRTVEATLTSLSGDAAQPAAKIQSILPDFPSVPNVQSMPEAEMPAAPVISEPVAHPIAEAPPAPRPEVPPATANLDGKNISIVLLEIVAEKTGYPAEMLALDMELEAGLGIDSIKQVEILSSLRDHIPSLPEIDPGLLGELRTLGQIVDYLEDIGPGITNAPVALDTAGTQAELNVTDVLLEIVAEKTGYPAEMLALDMELESGLGIDSIKQVEILSGLRDRVPSLPEIDPGLLGELRTLGQIVGYLSKNVSAPPSSLNSEADASAEETEGQRGGLAVEPILLEIVAEKTGYPAEMLALDMELEAGLGIDSIKQVEILSALRDRLPELPEVDPSMLAELRTLGQILDYIGETSLGEGSVKAEAAKTAELSSMSPPRLERLIPKVVDSPAVGLALKGIGSAERIAIVPDGRGICNLLIDEFDRRGLSAEIWNAKNPAPVVVDLSGLDKMTSDAEMPEFYWNAFRVSKAMIASHGADGFGMVTVQDSGGCFGYEGRSATNYRPAGLAALLKTVLLECPASSGKAIDITVGRQSMKTVARRIADEILGGGPEIDVGLGPSGRRCSISLESVSEDVRQSGESRLADGDFIVVSGGARGITPESLKVVVEHKRLRLLLLGRTKLEEDPICCRTADDDAAVKRALLEDAAMRGEEMSLEILGRQAAKVLACREIRSTILSIEAAGSQADYRAVDIADAKAVTKVIEIQRAAWGPVKAIIHGAGVNLDKRIADKTREQFDTVFRTKISGLHALLSAVKGDPVHSIFIYSSIAARNGNVGQSDYAIANEMLNKLAWKEADRLGEDCVVRAIGWGPWDGGMVNPALKKHFEGLGVTVIPPAAGADALMREFRMSDANSSEVVISAEATSILREWRISTAVDGATYPFIENHRVNGKAVLPVVLVIEWFMRLGRCIVPGLKPIALKDVCVLKGIVLDSYPDRQWFEIEASPIRTNGTVQVELRLLCADGIPRYKAEMELGSDLHAALTGFAENGRHRADWPYELSEIYEGKLFHGPAFQAVQTLEEYSDQGGSGIIAGIGQMGWPSGPWVTNPPALDGGMQLGFLWGMARTELAYLPQRLGSYIPHYDGEPPKGPFRCVFEARLSGSYRIECDLVFTSLDGKAVAELRDLELYGIENTANTAVF